MPRTAKPATKTKMRLKRGDRVRVMSGKNKGAEGRILSVLPYKNRVVVEGVNIIKKAQQLTQDNPRGGFRELEAAIHASNVRILDPKTNEPSRIGYTFLGDGRKVRVSVKSGSTLDE